MGFGSNVNFDTLVYLYNKMNDACVNGGTPFTTEQEM